MHFGGLTHGMQTINDGNTTATHKKDRLEVSARMKAPAKYPCALTGKLCGLFY